MQPAHFNKQRGVIFLTLTLVILAVLALVALISMKSTVTEQRVAGDNLAARQALAAADAGLAVGVAAAIQNVYGVETTYNSGQLNILNTTVYNPSSDPDIGSVTSILICPPRAGEGNQYHIIAGGESSDGKATRLVEEWVSVGTGSTTAGYVMGSWRDYGVTNSC